MDEAQDRPLLATYGTLLRGRGGQEALGIAETLSFVAPCRVEGALYALDSLSGAVPGEGTQDLLHRKATAKGLPGDGPCRDRRAHSAHLGPESAGTSRARSKT